MNIFKMRSPGNIVIETPDLIIAAVLILLICTGSMMAQTDPVASAPKSKMGNPASVAITPASIDTKVKPGASYTQNFSVVNNTNERLRVRMSSEDVWIDEQNKRIEGRPGTLPRSSSLWLQFTPPEFVVEPLSSGTVKAVITVPRDAAGSFYTVPVFHVAPVAKPKFQNASATAITASASIGLKFRAIMMLTTKIGSEYNVEIMSGNIIPPTASTEMELRLDLRNRGNAHAKVRGAFAILDAAGNLAGRGSITEKRLLPGQRKALTNRWSGELKPGDYIAIVTLSHDRVGAEPMSLVQEIPFKVK
ncbi:MAG: hypothetical protein AB7J13_05110 [Pyrinomonadaceae bacterium]